MYEKRKNFDTIYFFNVQGPDWTRANSHSAQNLYYNNNLKVRIRTSLYYQTKYWGSFEPSIKVAVRNAYLNLRKKYEKNIWGYVWYLES